jgi:ribosome assembly protein YihI (activator of Der GTPase)
MATRQPTPADETHEGARELSPDVPADTRSRKDQSRSGGHRGGSRGAGTFENSDGDTAQASREQKKPSAGPAAFP